jgi:class 3 adenylate cyclase/tetratricopeptide (TPR) repeat protein
MKCSECAHENPEDAKFCNECGQKLLFICSKCGKVNPLGSRFCDECRQNLKDKGPEKPGHLDYDQPQSYTPKHLADKILTHRSAIEGERKLVTVLFADVANFTAMSEKLDPEEVHQIMDRCFKILMEEIHKCEGTINQFTGDGVMALFGAPVAHEDHAQRACRAALAVQKALAGYGKKIEQQYDAPFQMRIGLNSGPVIVGAIGNDLRMDYTAVGDTTNLAARVEQHTEPEQVFLSRDTRNIIRDYFESESVGEMSLKGKSQPQTIYRLISEYAHVRNRFEAGLVRGVTELVGRKHEIAELNDVFEKVKSGEAQIVDVVGEAGIGKSRLIYEFRESLGAEGVFLTGLCMQYGGNINFLPVMDIVKAAFGIKPDMSEAEAGKRIEEKTTGELSSMIPFYRSLLSLKVEDPKFKALQPEGRKFGTFEAVKDLLLSLCLEKPLVVFVEDVHWIDKISEEFFTFLSRCIPEHGIMMLAAYRPENAPPWAQGIHYQRLGLETLSSKSSIHLVHNILGGLALEPALEKRIVEKTKGNPFFVEEIVRELLDRGDIVKSNGRYVSSRPIDQLHIPNTVQAVLAARMDRLSEDLKRTMQVASVIGRDFAFKILKTILEFEDELRGHLTNLVGLEILYEKAFFPELEYIFKHALTQEVAYESLLKQRRQAIHGRIAQAIEEIYTERLDKHYELLAHHYEKSGNFEKAIDYLILAGAKSNQQNAIQSALDFFQRTLFLAEKEGIRLDIEKEVQVRYGLAGAAHHLGELELAVNEHQKIIEMTENANLPEYESESLFLLAWLMIGWPDRQEADAIYNQVWKRSQKLGDKALQAKILSRIGISESNFNYPEAGLQTLLNAEKMAIEANDSRAIVAARMPQTFVQRWLGKPWKAVELTEGMIESLRGSYNLVLLLPLFYTRGLCLAEIGRIEEGMDLLKQGLEMSNKFGPFERHTAYLNCLGYCFSEICQPEKAWDLNLEGEKTARQFLEKSPTARLLYAEIVAQVSVNLVENLFDMGKIDAAWKKLKSFEKEAKSKDFAINRFIWELRMYYVAALILLHRNELTEAEDVIQRNLETARDVGTRKREGCFLRLLGEVQMRRNEFGAAIQNMRKGISILEKVGNPRKIWVARASLASAFEKIGNLSEAREEWRKAGEVIQRAANGLTDLQLREGFLSARTVRDILRKAV